VISNNCKTRNKNKIAWKEISFHRGIDVGGAEKEMKSLLAHCRRYGIKMADEKPKRFAYQRLKF
jgi:hypothetical protein